MSAPDLEIRALAKRFGHVPAVLGAELRIERGEIVSLLGPSGCGKSTLLNLVAGHLRPDAGEIRVAGELVAGDGVFAPPQRRQVGMVFQDFALFPHLDVAGNVGFPLRVRGLRARRDRARRVEALLDRLGIADLATRMPHELSGGQQQRVAIARALAQEPRLLLLDEPFSSLDGATREHIRAEIVGRLRETGLTCVFVTHDTEEALAISDKVAVMQGGTVLQVDDPETLYRRPFCREVAEFVGRANVLRGTAAAGSVSTEVGTFPIHDEAAQGEVEVLVRPELLDVRAADDGAATVVGCEFRGHDVVYTLRLASGSTVWAHRPSVDVAHVGARVEILPQPGYAVLCATRSELARSSTSLASPAAGGGDHSATSATSAPRAGLITSSQSGNALTATSSSADGAAAG